MIVQSGIELVYTVCTGMYWYALVCTGMYQYMELLLCAGKKSNQNMVNEEGEDQ